VNIKGSRLAFASSAACFLATASWLVFFPLLSRASGVVQIHSKVFTTQRQSHDPKVSTASNYIQVFSFISTKENNRGCKKQKNRASFWEPKKGTARCVVEVKENSKDEW